MKKVLLIAALVLLTSPAFAGYDIDNKNFDEILGTIAGDDTILLVIREGYSHSSIKEALSLIIPSF